MDKNREQRIKVVEERIDERIAEVWQHSELEHRKRFSREEVEAFARACYGKGYHDALTEDVPVQLLLETGYFPAGVADMLLSDTIELPEES